MLLDESRARNPYSRSVPDSNGGITAVSPDGETVEHTPLPDALTTNICFGGSELRTAYATLSSTGKLVSFAWPRAGLRLHY